MRPTKKCATRAPHKTIIFGRDVAFLIQILQAASEQELKTNLIILHYLLHKSSFYVAFLTKIGTLYLKLMAILKVW